MIDEHIPAVLLERRNAFNTARQNLSDAYYNLRRGTDTDQAVLIALEAFETECDRLAIVASELSGEIMRLRSLRAARKKAHGDGINTDNAPPSETG